MNRLNIIETHDFRNYREQYGQYAFMEDDKAVLALYEPSCWRFSPYTPTAVWEYTDDKVESKVTLAVTGHQGYKMVWNKPGKYKDDGYYIHWALRNDNTVIATGDMFPVTTDSGYRYELHHDQDNIKDVGQLREVIRNVNNYARIERIGDSDVWVFIIDVQDEDMIITNFNKGKYAIRAKGIKIVPTGTFSTLSGELV